MKQFKSDGRYKYNSAGLQYIVDFRWASASDMDMFNKLRRIFEDMYGPTRERIVDPTTGQYRWVTNINWQQERNRNAKRKRIYLREESALSLALLRIN